MKSYDIVGYADIEHGCCYCLDCTKSMKLDTSEYIDTIAPIFAGDEWDSFPVCDTCHEAITDICLIESD